MRSIKRSYFHYKMLSERGFLLFVFKIAPLHMSPNLRPSIPFHSFYSLGSFTPPSRQPFLTLYRPRDAAQAPQNSCGEVSALKEIIPGEDNFATKRSFISFVLAQHLLPPPSQFPRTSRQRFFPVTLWFLLWLSAFSVLWTSVQTWMFIAKILKTTMGCLVLKYHRKVSEKSLKFTNKCSSMGHGAKPSQK